MATFKVGDQVVTHLGRGDVVDVVEGAIDGVKYQAGLMVKLYTPIAEGSKFWFEPGELQPAAVADPRDEELARLRAELERARSVAGAAARWCAADLKMSPDAGAVEYGAWQVALDDLHDAVSRYAPDNTP